MLTWRALIIVSTLGFVISAKPTNAQPSATAPTRVLSTGVSKTRNISTVHAVEKLDLGNFNLFNGNTRQALQAYKTALQINPDLWEAHYGLANCYVRKHQTDNAIDECLQVLRIKPRHKDAAFLLANLYKSKGKLSEAITWYEKSRSLGTSSAGLYAGLGLAQVQSGLLSEGKINLEKSIELSKKRINAEANLGKAVIAFKEDRREEAISLLDLAIQQHGGRYVEARNFKAGILISQGRTKEAQKEYLTVIAHEDPPPETFQALGNLYLKEQDLNEAFKIFLQGSKWYPRNADILLGLAVVLERQNRLKEAVLAYKAAIKQIAEQSKKERWQKHLEKIEVLVSQR
ncbi:MAG: tetratricopeptide repeat protein [Candidatus Moraniibacteriota bacterium]|nr:MAG: tetratricopeptide repeat protein [Candidatus Moranbacteria bacterium]